jgi:hypothetical protein
MSVDEQQKVKETYYGEAVRYMDNANDFLKKAKKDGKFYQDPKYVKIACGTAYSGLLVALDGFCLLKGIHTSNSKKVRKSIEYYQKHIANQDKKMLVNLNGAYRILHLYGYYDGLDNVTVIREGFDLANAIIEKIKPKLN